MLEVVIYDCHMFIVQAIDWTKSLLVDQMSVGKMVLDQNTWRRIITSNLFL